MPACWTGDVSTGSSRRVIQDGLLAAVDAYRNPDGGYGSGLEADLRHGSSQPGAALHAFEAFAEIGPHTTDRSRQLCDWLESCALDDGGVPFALPIDDPTACSPFWVDADPTVSSAQITTAVTWAALRVARHDPATATHRWLNRSVDYCLAAIAKVGDDPHAYEVSFGLRFADAAYALGRTGLDTIEHLTRHLPADAVSRWPAGRPMNGCSRWTSVQTRRRRRAPTSLPQSSRPICDGWPASNNPTVAGRWTSPMPPRPPPSSGAATRP